MIKDLLKNAEVYYPLSKRIEAGFEWIKKSDLENIENGKYFIDGENLYVNVQTYLTKDDALFEAHRNYIDIQYMISGEECIGVCDYGKCSTEIPYDSEKDIEFLRLNSERTLQTLNTGEFLIFYPQDAHQPSLKCKENKIVKKAVVKVLLYK